MLPVKNRLRKSRDFDLTFRKGRSAFGSGLGIKSKKNNLEETRVGFVVSAKISKKATQRNLLKRRLREIFRLMLKKEELKGGYDLVVLTRVGVIEIKYSELKEEVRVLLSRLKLLS